MCKQTKLTSLTELTSRRRKSLFGDIARLEAAVPAHQAFCLVSADEHFNRTESGYQLEETAMKTWISQIPDDTGMSPRTYWDASIRRGHGTGTLYGLLKSMALLLMMMMMTPPEL